MQLNSRTILRGLLLAAALLPQVAQSAEIKVIAASALKDGYTELVAAFEKLSGHKVVTTWAGTVNAACGSSTNCRPATLAREIFRVGS